MTRKIIQFCMLIGVFVFAFEAKAQLFYNTTSSSRFDSTGSSTTTVARNDQKDNEPATEEVYDRIVSPEVRERIKPDAAVVLAKPDEVACYGVARKSPKKRGPTVSGYAHTGNCGVLNDVGLAEVQKKILHVSSFDMNVSKLTCIFNPRLVLRFRSGIDYVDAVLSGGNCPAVMYFYAGETKEFFARPMTDWLNTFIEAVSKDIEPVGGKVNQDKDMVGTFLKRKEKEITPKPSEVRSKTPPEPQTWGRRFD